jgi:hypothetical protein
MGAVASEMSPHFTAQMRRLLGLKFAPVSLQTHWEALHDLEDVLLTAVVDHAQKMSDEFPSPKILRGYASQLRARVIEVPQPVDRTGRERPQTFTTPFSVIRIKREWTYYCQDCSDSGWVNLWCEGLIDDVDDVYPAGKRGLGCEYARPCTRRGAHGAHEWTTGCPCAATNPDVLRKRERERQVKRGKDDE